MYEIWTFLNEHNRCKANTNTRVIFSPTCVSAWLIWPRWHGEKSKTVIIITDTATATSYTSRGNQSLFWHCGFDCPETKRELKLRWCDICLHQRRRFFCPGHLCSTAAPHYYAVLSHIWPLSNKCNFVRFGCWTWPYYISDTFTINCAACRCTLAAQNTPLSRSRPHGF